MNGTGSQSLLWLFDGTRWWQRQGKSRIHRMQFEQRFRCIARTSQASILERQCLTWEHGEDNRGAWSVRDNYLGQFLLASMRCLRADAAQPTAAHSSRTDDADSAIIVAQSSRDASQPPTKETELSLDSGQVQGRYRSVHRLGRQGGMRGTLGS